VLDKYIYIYIYIYIILVPLQNPWDLLNRMLAGPQIDGLGVFGGGGGGGERGGVV
jgi:hypothetical protein